MNKYEATKVMKDRIHFGCMMVDTGEADCLISGFEPQLPETIRPAIEIIGMEPGLKKLPVCTSCLPNGVRYSWQIQR